MSAPSLPDFERTLQLGNGSLDAAELAECHGLLCGLVCRESSPSSRDYLRQLEALRLVVKPGQALHAALAEVWASTVAQFGTKT
jgi:uncharacterized protein YgfB (UPF0149 family)